MHRLFALVAMASFVACTSRVDATNPYDPGTPDQQKAHATVRGTISAPSLTSPQGITVSLRQNNKEVSHQDTDAAGKFAFSDLIPGAYSLEVNLDGFLPLSVAASLGAGVDVDLGTLALHEAAGVDLGTISGHATLRGQTDHSGILVQIEGRAASTITDPAGAYSLALPAGSYKVDFSHANYGASVANATVAKGATSTVDVTLQPTPYSISGVVVAEQPAGGTAPAASVLVSIDGAALTAQTDSSGAFTLDNVPAGSWILRFATSAPYGIVTVPVLNLAANRTLTDQVVLPLQRGSLSGRVLLSDGAAPGDTVVELTPGGRTQLTAADGSFLFDGLVVGTYQLTGRRAGYQDQIFGSAFQVTVGAIANAGTFTLVANPARVSGHVDVEGPTGAPVAAVGATVSFDGTSLTAVTDALGDFTIGNVMPGSYIARAVLSPYASQTQGVLNLAGGEVRALPDPFFLAIQRGGLVGTVTLPGVSDSSGIAVELTGQGRSQLTSTDGSFSFDRLPIGAYEITARKDGYVAKILGSNFGVTANSVTNAGAFQLVADPATLKGHVDAEGPVALQGATVSIDGTSYSAITDVSGNFAITGVPPGSYVVRASKAPYADQLQSVLGVAGGEVRTLSAFLLPVQRGSITGVVTLSGQSDSSGVQIAVTGQSGTQLTAADGSFTLDRLPIGTYELTATKAGFLSKILGSAFAVQPNANTVAGTFSLSANPASISGHVDGELASGGKAPLASATVSLDGTSITSVTDGAGNFTLSNVPIGSYVVRAAKSGYRDVTQAALNLAGGEARTLADSFPLALARGALTGQVALSDVPGDASGVVVELTGTGLAQVTGSDGKFTFSSLIPASYEVSARRDNYSTKVFGTFAVQADQTTVVPLGTLARQGGAVTIQEAPYTNALGVHLVLSANNATGYHASEDPTFTDATKGDVTTSPWHAFTAGTPVSFTLQDADGSHGVYVMFFDGASTSGPVQSSIVVDRQAPAAPAVVIGSGGAYTNAAGGIVNLSISGQDVPAIAGAEVSGLAYMQLSNFSSFSSQTTVSYNTTTTWTLDNPTVDGLKTVYVRLIDRVGNVGPVTATQVRLDTTAPTGASIALTGTDPNRPGFTRQSLVTASLAASDANGGTGNANLLVRLSNTSGFVGATFVPFNSTLSWFLTPGDGAKTVYAQFMDPAGNLSLVASANITLDTAAPTGGVSLSPSGVTNATSITLTYSFSADVTGYKLFTGATDCATLPASAFAATKASETQTIGPAEGTYTFFVCYSDAAGNTASAQASLLYDKTPPSAILQAGDGSGYSPTANVSLALIGASSDFVSYRTALDTAPSCSTGAYAAWSGNASVTFTGDGAHTAYVCMKDTAGNVTSSALSAPVFVDTQAPTGGAAIAGIGASNKVKTRNIDLDLSGVSDPSPGSGLTGMQVLIDSTAFTTSFVTFQPLVRIQLPAVEGGHTVNVQVKDRAGNVKTLAAVNVTLDTTAPAGSVSLVANGVTNPSVTNATSVTLNYTPSADATGYVVASAPLDCASLGATAFSALPPGNTEVKSGLTAGALTFYVCFIDGAGNVAATSVSTTIDLTPPTATLTVGDGSGYYGQGTVPLTLVGLSTDASFVKTALDAAPNCATATYASLGTTLSVSAADGAHTVYVCLKDNAGNVTAQPLSGPVFIDTVAPGGSASVPAFTRTRSVTLDLSGVTDAAPSSGLSGLQVLVDSTAFGTAFTSFSTASVVQLPAAEGPHTINVQVRDRAGKTTTLAGVTTTLDTIAPTVALSLNVGALTNQSTVTLTHTISADVTGYALATTPLDCASLPASAFSSLPVGNSEQRTIPADGPITFYACYRDGAFNVSGATASTTLDTARPTATLQVASVSNSQNVTATLVGASTDVAAYFVSATVPNCASVIYGSSLTVTYSSDGAQTFYACLRDLAGNVSAAPLQAPVFVDTKAPQGSIAVPAKVNTRNIDVDLSGLSDQAPGSGITGMQLLVDSTAFGSAYQTFSQIARIQLPATEITHAVNVKVIDAAGWTYSTSANVTLDLTPPAGTVTLTAGGVTNPLFTNQSTVTLTYAPAADATGYKVSPSPMDCSSLAATDYAAFPAGNSETKTIGSAETLYTFYVCFRDGAGNTAATSVSTTYDVTVPTGTAVLGTGAAAQNTRAMTFAVTASSDTKQWSVSVDVNPACGSATYTSFTGSQAINFATTGSHTVYACLQDAAGNKTATAIKASVIADDSFPLSGGAGSIAITGTLGDGTTSSTYSATGTVTLAFAATDSGGSALTQMKVSNRADLSDASWQPYVASIPWTLGAGDGLKTVTAQFMDGAGNVSQSNASGTITLAQTPPSGGTVVINNGALATNVATVSLAISASGATEMLISPGAGAWAPYSTAGSATLADPEGVKSVSVRFRNAARVEGGNTSSSITYDHTAPAAPTVTLIGTLGNGAGSSNSVLYGGTPTRVYTTTLAVTVQIAPPLDDITQMAIVQGVTGTACSTSVVGATFVPFSPSSTFVFTGTDGDKRVCVVLQDRAGNTSTANAGGADLTLDSTAPSNPNFINLASGYTTASLAPSSGNVQVTASSDTGTNASGGVAYECIGGALTRWTACGTDPLNLTPFSLNAGINTLSVRARDAAFNYSPGSSVSITRDNTPPGPPAITSVKSDTNSISLTWSPSASSDVVNYIVNYGSGPGAWNGTGASQGDSPVEAGNATSFSLTGLTTGSLYYLSVVAVDAAGNQSSPSNTVLAVPNKINPRLLGVTGSTAETIGLLGGHVYVGGHQVVTKLDITTDGSAPVLSARVNVPNVAGDRRSSLPATTCTYQGNAGECVYFAGMPLESLFKGGSAIDTVRSEVTIVFFPNSASVAAQPIGSIPDYAIGVWLNGTTLVAADLTGIRTYSIAADPTNPSLVGKFTASSLNTIDSAGFAGPSTFYVASTDATNVQHLLRFTNLTSAVPTRTDMGSMTIFNGAANVACNAVSRGQTCTPIFSDFGVYAAYNVSGTSRVAQQTISGSVFVPGTAVTLPSFLGNSFGVSSSPVSAFGNRLYVFQTATGGAGATQGYFVNLVSGVPQTPTSSNAIPLEVGLSSGASPVNVDMNPGLQGAAAGNFGGNDHVVTAGAEQINRWSVATTATALTPLVETNAQKVRFATWGPYLYVAKSADSYDPANITTMDISSPGVVRFVKQDLNYVFSGSTVKINQLKVRGNYLYVGLENHTNSIMAFQLAADGGFGGTSYALRPPTGSTTVRDFAISGRYLFAVGDSAATGINVYDIGPISVNQTPAYVTNFQDANVSKNSIKGVDAVGPFVYTTGDWGLASYSWSGAAFTVGGWATDVVGQYVRVKGALAFVSTDDSTTYVNVGTPLSFGALGSPRPYFQVAGPVLFQSGYVTGPAPQGSGDGIRWVRFYPSAILEGTVPFDNCTPDVSNGYPGQVVWHNGVYYAACGQNGIQAVSAIDPRSGSLWYRNDITDEGYWYGGSMATDGYRYFMGAPYLQPQNMTYSSRIWNGFTQYVGSTGFSGPFETATTPTQTTFYLNEHEGHLYSTTGAQFDDYNIADDGTVSAPASIAISATGGGLAQPADDGRFLYVPNNGSLITIDTVPTASLVAPRVASTTLPPANNFFWTDTLYRNRLYVAATTNTNVGQIMVYSVGTPGSPNVSGFTSITQLPGALKQFNGLTVRNDTIFYTFESAAGGWGLGMTKLGGQASNLWDGSSGATFKYQFLYPTVSLGDLVAAGDTLIVRMNKSLVTYDLSPYFNSGGAKPPTRVGGTVITESVWTGDMPILLDGPFAYLAGGSFRIFDLR